MCVCAFECLCGESHYSLALAHTTNAHKHTYQIHTHRQKRIGREKSIRAEGELFLFLYMFIHIQKPNYAHLKLAVLLKIILEFIIENMNVKTRRTMRQSVKHELI